MLAQSVTARKVWWLVWTDKLHLVKIITLEPFYTGIKKPKFFSHSGFSLEVARHVSLNTAKKNESKNPPPKCGLLKLRWFFANVNARSPLTSIILVFGDMGRDLLRNHPRPRRTAHYVRSKVESSRACAPLNNKKTVWDLGFFAHALFLPKKLKVMGFSGSVNSSPTTKKPGFWDFGFCQCKWAYWHTLPVNLAGSILSVQAITQPHLT